MKTTVYSAFPLICIILKFFVGFAYCEPSSPRPEGCLHETASEQEVADIYFKPYEKWTRPRLNSSQPVNVNITFVLSSINDINEKERVIKVTAYISVRWFDEFRVWKDDFPNNCVDYVVLPAEEIWVPDIAQMNAEERYTLMTMKGEKVRVHNDGLVIYSPGGTFMAFYYDLTMFPFDAQRCTLKFESWRYTDNYVTFKFQNGVTLKSWSENEQWSLVSTSQELSKVEDTLFGHVSTFDHMEFHIALQRKVTYYLMNIIIPSSIISVAQLATFSLPVDEVLKIHISFTCLLAYGIFQLLVVGDMPRSSDHVPLLSIYIDLSMGYISLSMLLEGLVFLALRETDPGFHRHASKPPQLSSALDPGKKGSHVSVDWFSMFGHATTPSYFSEHFGMEPATSSPANMAQSEQQEEGSYSHRHHFADQGRLKWQYTADVLDRFTAAFYSGCLIVTPVVMFGLYPAAVAENAQNLE